MRPSTTLLHLLLILVSGCLSAQTASTQPSQPAPPNSDSTYQELRHAKIGNPSPKIIC